MEEVMYTEMPYNRDVKIQDPLEDYPYLQNPVVLEEDGNFIVKYPSIEQRKINSGIVETAFFSLPFQFSNLQNTL